MSWKWPWNTFERFLLIYCSNEHFPKGNVIEYTFFILTVQEDGEPKLRLSVFFQLLAKFQPSDSNKILMQIEDQNMPVLSRLRPNTGLTTHNSSIFVHVVHVCPCPSMFIHFVHVRLCSSMFIDSRLCSPMFAHARPCPSMLVVDFIQPNIFRLIKN